MIHARYRPTGKTGTGKVHAWDDQFNGEYAAKSLCEALTVMTDRLEKTEDVLTCGACVHARALREWEQEK